VLAAQQATGYILRVPTDPEKRLALRVFAMPKDTNHYGTAC